MTDKNNSVLETQNNDLPNISAKQSDPSEEHTESPGNVEISEFDDTVDYGEESSNEESSDESEEEVPQKAKPKPDWSLPLITPTNNKERIKNDKLRRSSRRIPLPKLKPQRLQPRRATKSKVMYGPCTSESESDDSSESDHRDEDYIPESAKGKYHQLHSQLFIRKFPHEYFHK